jgi:hypothetical protein
MRVRISVGDERGCKPADPAGADDRVGTSLPSGPAELLTWAGAGAVGSNCGDEVMSLFMEEGSLTWRLQRRTHGNTLGWLAAWRVVWLVQAYRAPGHTQAKIPNPLLTVLLQLTSHQS